MFKRIAIFLFSLCLISCKKENAFDCFAPNGKVISEWRYPKTFSAIEMNDNIEVTIFKGADYKLEVIAGQNIIKNIYTGVEEGVLKIENRNKCNFVRGYKKKMRVNITLPYFHTILSNGVARLNLDEAFSQDTVRIKAESSGDVHINGTYDCINVVSSGNGDVYVSGTCKAMYVYMSGTNYLRAENLQASDKLFIETLTLGDCFVNAKHLKQLEYKLWREGNIYYRGDPDSLSGYYDKDSKGKLIRQE